MERTSFVSKCVLCIIVCSEDCDIVFKCVVKVDLA